MENESDLSDDERSPGKSSSVQSWEQNPYERHALLFHHGLNPTTVDLQPFHPLPSQVPFLVDVFSENVNIVCRLVHVPSLMKTVRESRGTSSTPLSISTEALLFSIYYAAITSLDEDDVRSPPTLGNTCSL
jgi:hypothetical protein